MASNKKGYTLFVLFLFLCLSLTRNYLGAQESIVPASSSVSKGGVKTGIRNWEYIKLSSSNWEAVGDTIKITSDGSYARGDIGPRARGNFKTGRVDMVQLNEIIRLLEDVNFYSLNDEYIEPGTSRLEIRYQLSIKTDTNLKSVRFDSESETVPHSLLEIATRIESLVE